MPTVAIEEALNLSLPDCYREAVLAGLLAPVLNSDARSVVAINGGIRDGEYGDDDWPPSRYIFGDNGAGDLFCLETTSAGSQVFVRDHETLC